MVFTNNTNLIHNTIVTPTIRNISHHSMVTIQTQYKAPIQSEDPTDSPRLSPLDYLNFHSNDINWKSMNKEIEEQNWENLLNDKPPSEMLDAIYTIIHQASETHIPQRKQPISQKNKNRYLREKENLKRKKRRINKQICNAKSPAKRDRLFKRLVDEEVKLQKLAKQTNMFHEHKAINTIKENAKYFFSYAKRKSKIKTKIGPLLNKETAQMTNNSIEMAELLADQYSSVFSKPTTEPPEIDDNTLPINNIIITPAEMMDAIDELRSNAASGPDGIPSILLKKCKNTLAKVLSTFWNKCMEDGNIPSSLKSSIIPPIHKGGNKSDAANYRPVALTSHIIKIYEKVIRNRLTSHLDNNNSLNKNQHGFRKGRSCLTQLLAHHDNIMNLLEQGFNVDVVYLDFAKAFDKVDHNILLHKLKSLGINGKTLRWIQSFLEDRVQRVVVNGQLSTPSQVISGVPQGSVLGPLLFLVLIGDIDENIVNSLIASFADDTRATKGIKTESDAAELQNDLFRIYDWSIKNNMEFNSIKFELLRYGLDNALKESTKYVTPEWELIESKDTVKDLGITLENNCSFKQHITNRIEAAKRMSAWVFRTFSTRERLPLMTLYKSLVRPLVEYSSVLWSPTSKADIKRLEEVQKSFIRKINGVNSDYKTALKQLNLYSLERRRERYMIMQIWKSLENLAPNTSSTEYCTINAQTDINHRRGRTCQSHNLTKTPTHLLQARKQSLRCFGANMFNKLPKHIRNITNTSVDVFKSKLDKYLRSIEDPASLSHVQPNWLHASRPATVCEEIHTDSSMIPRDIEQITPVSLIIPVAEESSTPASGLTVEELFTQTS